MSDNGIDFRELTIKLSSKKRPELKCNTFYKVVDDFSFASYANIKDIVVFIETSIFDRVDIYNITRNKYYKSHCKGFWNTEIESDYLLEIT